MRQASRKFAMTAGRRVTVLLFFEREEGRQAPPKLRHLAETQGWWTEQAATNHLRRLAAAGIVAKQPLFGFPEDRRHVAYQLTDFGRLVALEELVASSKDAAADRIYLDRIERLRAKLGRG